MQLTLSTIVLNLAADMTQAHAFRYVTARQAQPTAQGGPRLYANGVLRNVNTPGVARQIQAALTAVTPAQRVLLEEPAERGGWAGETVLYRDDAARGFWCVFPPAQVTDHSYNGECDLTVVFNEITVAQPV